VVKVGGVTSQLEVTVNRTSKDQLKQLYSECLFAGRQCSDTNQENKESWGRTDVPMYQWIKTSRQQISPEVIFKGFKKCYISHAMDGRESDI
jgi:hypothetical protein